MGEFEIAGSADERDQIVPEEGLPTGDVELPQVAQQVTREKLDPLSEGQVSLFIWDRPDVAHAAVAYAAMGDLQTYGLRPTCTSRQS